MRKKEIRITIDGPCFAGKTLLAHAFSEFLRQNGVEDSQISFFNDGMPAEADRDQILQNALANGIFKETEFAFVERVVPRSSSVAGQTAWSAKPEKYSTVFVNFDHINMEMGRFEPPKFNMPGHWPSRRDGTLVPNRALVKVVDTLRLRKGTREILGQQLQHGEAVNSAAALLPHKPVTDMIRDAEIRQEAGEQLDEGILNFLELAEAFGTYNEATSKIDPLFRFGGLNKVMADPELRKQAIAYLQAKHPIDLEAPISTEYLDRLVEGLAEPRPESEANFGGVVLGHPSKNPEPDQASVRTVEPDLPVLCAKLWQNNGDHNGELESGYKYRMQIHPRTGETRDQMVVRATPFIKQREVDGQLFMDYSNLPEDLVFDPQCGVRWYTQEELAVEGKRYASALEFKHHGLRVVPNLTMKPEYKFDVFVPNRSMDKLPKLTTIRILMGGDTWMAATLERDHPKYDELLQSLRDCGYIVTTTKHMEVGLERERARILNPEPRPAFFGDHVEVSQMQESTPLHDRFAHQRLTSAARDAAAILNETFGDVTPPAPTPSDPIANNLLKVKDVGPDGK